MNSLSPPEMVLLSSLSYMTSSVKSKIIIVVVHTSFAGSRQISVRLYKRLEGAVRLRPNIQVQSENQRDDVVRNAFSYTRYSTNRHLFAHSVFCCRLASGVRKNSAPELLISVNIPHTGRRPKC